MTSFLSCVALAACAESSAPEPDPKEVDAAVNRAKAKAAAAEEARELRAGDKAE